MLQPIKHVFMHRVPEYLSPGTGGPLFQNIPQWTANATVSVSSICKWWLIIYSSLHQSSELVVCSRPLPLPRTMGPFPVGCEAAEGTGQYCQAGTSYQRVLPLEWKTDSIIQWDSWSVCWEVTGQDWSQVCQTPLQTSYWPLPRGCAENLFAAVLGFINKSMMWHITDADKEKENIRIISDT